MSTSCFESASGISNAMFSKAKRLLLCQPDDLAMTTRVRELIASNDDDDEQTIGKQNPKFPPAGYFVTWIVNHHL
jgi:hypothetical protein